MPIIGEYPCCNGDLWLGEPDNMPKWLPEACPHCGEKVWHLFRWDDSQTYLEAEFLQEYEVNEAEKRITKRLAGEA